MSKAYYVMAISQTDGERIIVYTSKTRSEAVETIRTLRQEDHVLKSGGYRYTIIRSLNDDKGKHASKS